MFKFAEVGTQYFVNSMARTKHKVFLEDTSKLSVGTYFAKKKRTVDIAVASAGAPSSVNEADIKPTLYSKKLKPIFDSMTTKITAVRPMDENIVDIFKDGMNIFADVICPFCPGKKSLRIQCDPQRNSNVLY